MKQFLIVAFSSFLLEIGSTFYITYVSEKNIIGMVIFAALGPFLSLPFVGFIVQTKTWKEKLTLALTSAIGYAIGSVISYMFINNI